MLATRRYPTRSSSFASGGGQSGGKCEGQPDRVDSVAFIPKLVPLSLAVLGPAPCCHFGPAPSRWLGPRCRRHPRKILPREPSDVKYCQLTDTGVQGRRSAGSACPLCLGCTGAMGDRAGPWVQAEARFTTVPASGPWPGAVPPPGWGRWVRSVLPQADTTDSSRRPFRRGPGRRAAGPSPGPS